MTYKLYCFGESGHSYKAALALELAQLPWEPVFVDFFGGEGRGDAFRDLNIMAECPVLVTPADAAGTGTRTLSQSGVILQYISDQTGHFAGAPEDKYEVMRWVLWDNHKFSSQIGMTRFMMNFVPEDKRSSDVIAFMQARLKPVFTALNAHLDGRDWIVGDGLTQADLSCCSYLFYPEPFEFDRKDWPHIDAWMTRLSALPGWKNPYDLMPGNPSDRA